MNVGDKRCVENAFNFVSFVNIIVIVCPPLKTPFRQYCRHVVNILYPCDGYMVTLTYTHKVQEVLPLS